MKTRVVAALIATMLGAALDARADTVRLRSGQEVEGRLSAESYTIASPDQGTLVVPIASIRALHFGEGETVTVELVEGQELQGRFGESQIELDRGLFSSRFAPADVAEILVDPRAEAVTLPQGTRLRLMLAEWLNSRTAESGQVVRFCVAEDVEVHGKTALPRGWPAIGEVTASRGAAKMSQRGMVALEPKYVMDAGGGRIPVKGSGEFSGGLKPGAFIGAGVLGFLDSGEEVAVPAGTVFEVTTDQEARVAVASVPEDSEALSHCRDFFRFAEAEVVPLDEIDLHAPYAPFGTSITMALPLQTPGHGPDGLWGVRRLPAICGGRLGA